jgi:hypothetical protein
MITWAAMGIPLAAELSVPKIQKEIVLTRAMAAERGRIPQRMEEYHVTCTISHFGKRRIGIVSNRTYLCFSFYDEESGK